MNWLFTSGGLILGFTIANAVVFLVSIQKHSCLENPRDGGAWWAALYGVAQSRTQLK